MTTKHMPLHNMNMTSLQGVNSQMGMPQMNGMGQQLNFGNSFMQQQMRSGGQGMGQGLGPGMGQDQHELIAGNIPLDSNVTTFEKGNIYKAMEYLINKKGWTADFAASWLGQAAVETGNYDLKDLDVVERGTGAGRGMFQYTNERRGPYDRARQKALQKGQNPNSIEWQVDYALNGDNPAMNLDAMREGLTDPQKNYTFHKRWGTATGISPAGERYGNKFSNANQLMAAYGKDKIAGYSRALAGEYTRPGTIHLDRRTQASKHYYRMYNLVKAEQKRRQSNPVPT